MYCLLCNKQVTIQLNWQNMLYPRNMNGLCETCEKQLEKLQGPRCESCSRMTVDVICPDCHWWQQHYKDNDPLTVNHAVYTYSDMMQDVIAKWKYRGDYVLGHIFRDTFNQAFKKHFSQYKDFLLIPIPLSVASLKERGFNQAKMLADFLPAEKQNVLARISSEKQSKKTRKQRLMTQNSFQAIRPIQKPAILVDDIYTTGTTLRHAAEILKRNGCPSVSSFTLIRG